MKIKLVLKKIREERKDSDSTKGEKKAHWNWEWREENKDEKIRM